MPNYRLEARKAAIRHGINPNLFVRQIGAESNFDVNAGSSAGARGIAQWMPATAREHGVNMNDPLDQLDKAAAWMASLIKQHGGWGPALSVYNSGKPDAYLDPHFAQGQTYNYVRKILGDKHPELNGPTGSPQTALGLGAGADALQGNVTAAQDGAASIRAQARQNLSDIATGQAKATDALAKLPKLQQEGSILPSSTTVPQVATAGSTKLERQAVTFAKKYLGYKYTWGGETPETGFDCSGLVQYLWKTLGVNVPRTTYEQWDAGREVGIGQLKPGDAVFFTGSDPRGGRPGHEGLYIGEGKFIEAPGTGKTVRISQLAGRSDFVGARRFG